MENDEKIYKEDEKKLAFEQDQIDENPQDSSEKQPEESVVEIDETQHNVIEEPSGIHTPSVVNEVPEVKKMPDWLRKSLIFLAVGLLLILIGYLISYFTTTVPTKDTYQTVLQELNNKEIELNNMQTQFDQTSNDLLDTQNNLDRIRQDYQSLELNYNQLLSDSEFNRYLIDLKYEISRAKYALLNEDRLSADLAMSLAKDKFAKIQILLASDISTGMNEQLQEIQKLVRTNPKEAMDELRTLSENLDRIPLK